MIPTYSYESTFHEDPYVLSDEEVAMLLYWQYEFMRLLGARFDLMGTFLYWCFSPCQGFYANPKKAMPMRYPSGFV